MPRTVSGPAWVDDGRMAGYIALALAESSHDRVRLRRVMRQITDQAPADVAVPDAADVLRDLEAAISRLQSGAAEPRRGELLRLVALDGVPRQQAAERLFLSERQFYRVRQEAAQELADELTTQWRTRRLEGTHSGIPGSQRGSRIAGERLPVLSSFVGRAAELEEATQSLRTHGMLLLGGPPGIGKTALGAQVVSIESTRHATAWHRFRSGLSDSPAAVLITLARALAGAGDPRLEELIGGAAGRTLWLPGAIDLAKRSIGETPWLLWFDDTDVIVDDEDVCGLIQLLFEECPDVRILLTGRAELWRLREVRRLVLPGLRRAEVSDLLASLGIQSLDDRGLDALIDATGGSPQLLRLAGNLLITSARPEQALTALADEPDVSGFLLHNVWQGLKDDQRELLRGTSLLRGPVTAAFLSRAFADFSDSVPDALVRLSQQFLLAGSEGGLRLHSSLRQYCSRQLPEARRQELHARLAHTYAADGESAEASHHWLEAGMLREAGDVLVASSWLDLSVDRRESLVELSDRLIGQLERPNDDVLLFHCGLLRSLGRAGQALELLRAHPATRSAQLVLTRALLERGRGDRDAARSALSHALSANVPRRDRWRLWWELARLEWQEGHSAAAVRAAQRSVESATDDDHHRARVGQVAMSLLPSAARLDDALPGGDLDPGVLDAALSIRPSADDGLFLHLTAAAVSRGLPAASALLRRLRMDAVASSELLPDLWMAEAIESAGSGDYRKAGPAMWRAAERAAALGRLHDAALAARTAALYRVMAGDPATGQAHLHWAEALSPDADIELLVLVEAVRWSRARAGEPPAPARGEPPVLAASHLLISAARSDTPEACHAAAFEAMDVSRGAAVDLRMVLLDLALGVTSDGAWETERRERRLGTQLRDAR
jgi:predicted DNA-binding protein (UPF0251 family)